MAREWYPTAAQVISAAARGLGLVSADITDPYASTNPAVLQMCQLLNDLGQDLARDYDWQQLRSSTTVNLDGTGMTASSAVLGICWSLPADLLRIYSDTVWNQTADLPLIGPMSDREWAALAAYQFTTTLQLPWRPYQDQFCIYMTSTSSGTVEYDYASGYWAGTSTTDRSLTAPTAATNILYFDRRLLVEGLKLALAEAKGMPSEGIQRRYNDALDHARANNEGARTLSLNQPRGLPWPVLPQTGWGL